MEPIGSFLTGQRLRLAELQDYVIDIIYDYFHPDALLYGGTAIWRCFGGMRFSDDLGLYMDMDAFSRYAKEPDARGFIPMPLKIAGNEISIIVALIVAINTPRVVLESATHLY